MIYLQVFSANDLSDMTAQLTKFLSDAQAGDIATIDPKKFAVLLGNSNYNTSSTRNWYTYFLFYQT